MVVGGGIAEGGAGSAAIFCAPEEDAGTAGAAVEGEFVVCCATALSDANNATVKINFQVRITFSPDLLKLIS
jgi:hypothetical protein